MRLIQYVVQHLKNVGIYVGAKWVNAYEMMYFVSSHRSVTHKLETAVSQ